MRKSGGGCRLCRLAARGAPRLRCSLRLEGLAVLCLCSQLARGHVCHRGAGLINGMLPEERCLSTDFLQQNEPLKLTKTGGVGTSAGKVEVEKSL